MGSRKEVAFNLGLLRRRKPLRDMLREYIKDSKAGCPYSYDTSPLSFEDKLDGDPRVRGLVELLKSGAHKADKPKSLQWLQGEAES